MNTTVPQPVLEIYNTLDSAGYEVYLVGGCVRDMLLSKEVKDWDLTTNATPEQMMQLFPDSFYDNQFGTVGIPISLELGVKSNEPQTHNPKLITHNQVVEITTYRTERDYQDGRHPTSVAWGKTIEEDLERRDFTINAMALKINSSTSSLSSLGEDQGEVEKTQSLNEEKPHPHLLLTGEGEQGIKFTLTDPFNGQEDLKNHIIRAVGDASKRFKEDALRLMRAVRFATQLSFTIDETTWKSMQEDAMLLEMISAERIHDELLKILASDFPYEGIMLLKNSGLLEYILPELLEGIGVSQERPGRHHTTDVFTHNTMALKLTPAKDPVVRFATLIHDIAKPRVQGIDKDGLVIFYNHEIAGAQMAYEIANRLHLSKKDRKKIVTLIRWHMFTVDEHITDAAVRRFIRRIGVENVKDMIDLRIGDRLGSGTQTAESWRLKLFKERIEKELAPGPFSINDLAIDGNDIMKELHIKPGKIVGELLQKIFEEVDENLELNNKEYLLKKVKELFGS